MEFNRRINIYKFIIFLVTLIQINFANFHLHNSIISKKNNFNELKILNLNITNNFKKFHDGFKNFKQNGNFISIGNNEYVFIPSASILSTGISTNSTKPQSLQSQLLIEHNNDNEDLHKESNINNDVFEIGSNIAENIKNVNVKSKYLGAQLWKIHITDARHLVIKKLKKYYGAEIWDMNIDGLDIFFENDVNAFKAKSYIDTTDVTYNIMIEDVQAAIQDTFRIANLTKENVPWLRSDELIMTWDRYQGLHNIYEFYYYTVDKFSQITQLITIGRTHEKRDINVIKISNGNTGNSAIFIDSGMQAREWIGPAALTLAISKFLYNYKSKPLFMKNIDWYFLPVSNPDGYEYSRNGNRLWSKNLRNTNFCKGVNLDRNFNYQWGKKGSTGNPCSFFYRGPDRFSEPESVALKKILLQLGKKVKAYISIGSYGQIITYPWGDEDFVPNTYKQMHSLGKKIVKAIREKTGAEYQIGSSYGLKFARSGNSADWVMDTIAPKYVFNVYLRDQGRYGYLLPPNFIIQSGFDVYEIMKTIAQDISN